MTWTMTTLGQACNAGGGKIQTGPFGSQLHASDYVATGIPTVMPQNIGDNRIVADGIAQISEDDAARLDKHRLAVNNIVYSRRGDVERRALVRPENEGWLCGTGCLRVNFGDAPVMNPAFIFYYLGTEECRRWIVQHAVGATMLNLNTEILSNVPLRIPPIRDQDAIAEVLGALDDKIAANTKLALLAEDIAYMRYRVGTAALEQVPMSEMLAPVLGGTPSRSRNDYWGGNQRWVSGRDVTGAFGHLILDTEEKITTAATKETTAKPLPKGSVILTARGTVGAVARLGEPSSFNQSCYGFVPGDVPPAILYFTIRSAAQHAKSIAHGSVFDTITMKSFEHLLVPLITGNEAQVVEETLSPLLFVVEASARENLELSKLRDSLLPHLMSGKLRVKDAEKVVEAVV